MKKYKWWLILFNLVMVLFLFNASIISKEKMLSNGKLVLLKLAPVDPRSLMQGDYMRLNYEISSGINIDSIPQKGYCIVTLDKEGIAGRQRLQANITPLNTGEYAIKYRAENWNINIGAGSYFFEEGQSDKYAEAKFGAIRIDNEGNSLLVGLYDEKLRLIK